MTRPTAAAPLIALLLAGLLAVPTAAVAQPATRPDLPDWVAPMRKVHAKFDGRAGTFAQFGDSITVTLAFWTPLRYARKNASPAMQADYALVSRHMRPECWRDWKGPAFGSQGSMTIEWARKNVDAWLAKCDPEVIVLMFGTNDLHAMELEQHKAGLVEVINKCLANGSVVILTTIPPRAGFEAKAAAFAKAQRDVARQLGLPLIDFQAEILARRPDDWNGRLGKFEAHRGYDVPTLIARDGVHPSNPNQWQDDYSPESLKHNGFALRNSLTLAAYAEVIRRVIRVEPAASQPAAESPAPAKAGSPAKPDSADRPASDRQSSAPAVSGKDSGPDRPAVMQDWFAKAPPLPPPTGEVIEIRTADELCDKVRQARPGTTILIPDGHYMLPWSVQIRADRVTLRGKSGNRDAVILDAARSGHDTGISVTGCSDVTIADLTLTNVRQNGYKINSDSGVHNVRLYNCVGHNIWQRHVKGVPGPVVDGRRQGSRNCVIEYCLFYNDRAKRLDDEPYERANPDNFGGNYVGGIDVMNISGWTIRDNVITGIRGRTGTARGAIFIWNGSADSVIERNVILDCDSGICLGNAHRADEWKAIPHADRMTVRNNFVTRCPEGDIVLVNTRDCRVLHNTVHDPDVRFRRLFRAVFDNPGLRVTGNLFSGPGIAIDNVTGQTHIADNATGLQADRFVEPARGNLHVKAEAAASLKKVARSPAAAEDIDRQPRPEQATPGADEPAMGR